MNASGPHSHDHHHDHHGASTQADSVSGKTADLHAEVGHVGHGVAGAHDRHEGHSVAMFRDLFYIRASSGGSELRVFIDYDLPNGLITRANGRKAVRKALRRDVYHHHRVAIGDASR